MRRIKNDQRVQHTAQNNCKINSFFSLSFSFCYFLNPSSLHLFIFMWFYICFLRYYEMCEYFNLFWKHKIENCQTVLRSLLLMFKWTEFKLIASICFLKKKHNLCQIEKHFVEVKSKCYLKINSIWKKKYKRNILCNHFCYVALFEQRDQFNKNKVIRFS